jgi:predicted ABC-type ATPase
VAEATTPGRIYVLAGTNGAGKSSIAGAMLRQAGSEYFNPDEAARLILARNPGLTGEAANGAAWQVGKRLLERAVATRGHFAFETTLGGRTITEILAGAVAAGLEVRIWYVGLDGPELHVARVRARVARGGHDIPEARIRARYDSSRLNLIRLLPGLTALWVYDNSVDADPQAGAAPAPRLVLHMAATRVVTACGPEDTPEWAKPIVAAALKIGATAQARRSR